VHRHPQTGMAALITIPSPDVRGPTATNPDGATLAASTGATLTPTTVANPTFRHFASFSSAGPRGGDGHLKPDVSAPGISIFSTGMGTVNQGVFMSGPSMAAPHVAGIAALAIQAHPAWHAADVAAAIVNPAHATEL